MNKFEIWLLKRILAKAFIQSPKHISNLEVIYTLIRSVWVKEFREDNAPTTDTMLRETFEKTQYKPIRSKKVLTSYPRNDIVRA